ncbi:DUF1775 domain-containing protein [Streptomyces luteolifulvus]|uniref:DUF1775 domain-containing protein n=1 Tax=Streptomyces luteolifulvus TaxID=2615112 RepID=A0A6H9UYP7_9ACTN|nr:DUF1775 domain-containing protein [Streptomyces luteolifulvus]KAB1144676.1 DUF1775 domain-containing protein [Streptomyces luteolifulvus]
MFHVTSKHSTARRLTVLTAATAAAVCLTAGPAFAHVEVEADKAQALAENVEISFDAESESDTAGITEVRVVLPEGIAPADVTYGEGPKGWKFTAGDDGYTVEGPALKAGVNAEYSVVVKQLPDAEKLAFKTLQTYSDGRIDRWIELDQDGENPAPTLKLRPAAPGAKPASPSPAESETASSSPTPVETEPSSSPAAEAKEKDDDSGLSTGAWVGIGVAVVVVAGGAVYAVRRRTSDQG